MSKIRASTYVTYRPKLLKEVILSLAVSMNSNTKNS